MIINLGSTGPRYCVTEFTPFSQLSEKFRGHIQTAYNVGVFILMVGPIVSQYAIERNKVLF